MDDKMGEFIAEELSKLLASVTFQRVYILCLEMGLQRKYTEYSKFIDIVTELSKAYVMNMFSFQDKLDNNLSDEEKVSKANDMAEAVCRTSIQAMINQ